MSNILNIGKSALNAASVAITTTGHNIANATTPGYNRQEVLQTAAPGQNIGVGFIGKGTEVTTIKRIYSEYLNNQVLSAQTSKSYLDEYYTQIKQIDNMLADSSSGLSPTLQGFFGGVQDLSSAAGSSAARQTMLSSAETLVGRFQSMAAQLSDFRDGVNDEIESSVEAINTYSGEIARLNDAIVKAQNNGNGQPPNDLLDQRDQAIAELSKQVKVSVVKQGDNYDVYIGNGQPLVVGTTTYDLEAVESPTDPNKTVIAYENNGKTTILPENSMDGGSLEGLFEFRSQVLDVAQNTLGRIAITLASDFNAQHKLGIDLNGKMGGNFFDDNILSFGAASKSAVVSGSIGDTSKLTISDYQLRYDGTNYSLTRLSDGTKWTGATLGALKTTSGDAFDDGFSLSISGTPAAGDTFMLKPTANGASAINVAIKNVSDIAAAAPVTTKATSTNKGTGAISAGQVDANFSLATVSAPITLTYDDGTSAAPPTAPYLSFTGLPTGMTVDVTVNGTTTNYPANAVPYTDGATISFGGISFEVSGKLTQGDSFTVESNKDGAGDNRNMKLLAALQTSNTIAGKTTNYQGSYSQFVNFIGNKTAELETTSKAAASTLEEAKTAQQAQSGVNLDEEAINLMRYQQSYQAAAKVLQTASTLFDTLLSSINN